MDSSLTISRRKLNALVEIYAPMHPVNTPAKSALSEAIKEFEQAVREDERTKMPKLKADELRDRSSNELLSQLQQAGGAPLDPPNVGTPPDVPPVVRTDVVPGAQNVVETEDAPREIGEAPAAPVENASDAEAAAAPSVPVTPTPASKSKKK